MGKNFYITTTAPYVNARPHIGFALEAIQADVIARYKRLFGYNVAFGFGTDEHGVKIYRKAISKKKDPKIYCDEYAQKYDQLIQLLNLSTTHFMRTTDTNHIKAAQTMWKLCYDNGDIYKKNYNIKYCVGCELEKTDSELVDNKCPTHPNLEIESYQEENYFFRFSKYQDKLLELYNDNPSFIIPQSKLNEITSFVKKGLQDFSISRLKSKMPWGIDVPGDPAHVMYVWFDALVFYISTLGWPQNKTEFEKWWPVVQLAGKDNLRQQSAIWQAMLFSAGLPTSKQIIIHGFITSNGQKMSKSLDNVIDPVLIVNKYGIDAVRYYLLREIPSIGDGDFSEKRFKELYNSDLANGLGNLVARVLTLAEKINLVAPEDNEKTTAIPQNLFKSGFKKHIENFELNIALENVWNGFKEIDAQINRDEPWKNPQATTILSYITEIRSYVNYLRPFLPSVSEKIMKATKGKINKIPILFPRIS
ncbi:methionine--tRNA ligase [Candidatus Roizmanbacteria bacterium CG_4_10_14_0_8_um_filter_33_9]|uniref:Methionine--tRNA ligase n=1 Tax=Candidatus Roizmanbacteria bacterium CG_4_10_14_0_8_um_filter_33_9 TaxID=1974826 RepID=A0A2M7QJI4_9BACT|nr:MAG: methionine--tRNA ligase [Candidatus Roizmanbacteria bacterium CG_4_10_14_0_8_um_filter_33_9]